MSPSLEFILKNGFILDAFGVIGLGLVGLAAVRLSRRYGSWGGSLMASGALLLLLGRLWVLIAGHFLTHDVRDMLGSDVLQVLALLPTVLLTAGLAGIVWGLWGHEKWLREEER